MLKWERILDTFKFQLTLLIHQPFTTLANLNPIAIISIQRSGGVGMRVLDNDSVSVVSLYGLLWAQSESSRRFYLDLTIPSPWFLFLLNENMLGDFKSEFCEHQAKWDMSPHEKTFFDPFLSPKNSRLFNSALLIWQPWLVTMGNKIFLITFSFKNGQGIYTMLPRYAWLV